LNFTTRNWREIGGTIRTAAEMERSWQGKIPQAPAEKARYTPWMPFQLFRFIAMLAEALPEITGPHFLEIGAGIGTKMRVAEEMFLLDVHGIELADEYAAVARTMGLDVVTADALDWPGYGGYDLIWCNRVFRDPEPQRQLEDRVWRTSDPGAVIMCANLETRPPVSWYPVLDEWDDCRAGIWQKPSGPAAG